MAASDLAERKYLDSAYGDGRAATWPAIVYAALYSGAPTDSTGGTEISGSGYARVAVANTSANFPAAATTSGVTEKKNATAIQFPTVVTSAYPTVTHWATTDAASGGNVLDYAPVTTPVAPAVGTTPVFQPNTLVLQAD